MTYQILDNGVLRDATADEAAEIAAQISEGFNVMKTEAINRAYSDVDTVTFAAVGNRTEEYKDAENDARAFKAAGYTGTTPPSVACYAQYNPTGQVQTDQWATDQIIARADAFAQAKLAMRSQRMASQNAMRAAADTTALSAAVDTWNSFISNIRTQLGL